MSVRGTWRQGPACSRVIMVAGGLVVLAGTAALVWAQMLPARSWAFPVSMAVWLAVMLGLAIISMYASRKTFRKPHLRPVRFGVVPGGFDVPSGATLNLSPVLSAMPSSLMVVNAVGAWRQAEADSGVAAYFLSTAAAILVALNIGVFWLAWRGLLFWLTPEGIVVRNLFAHTVIPWQAMAPGGPPRPALNWSAASRLRLALTQPELVRRKGWDIGMGSKTHPDLPPQNDIHPWFLADVIRWYAEHPEDRAAIGTQAEHERLLNTLGVEPAPPPAP